MRSFPLMAATTVIVALASACGGDGSGTGPNNDPVANFTAGACTANAPCTFTDASTDPDGNSTITGRKWNFGDNSIEVTDPALTQNHTFAAAGVYQVTLTVTDNGGKTDSQTNPVTVTAVANQLPVANFDVPACIAGTPCGFHSTSTDPDGNATITTTHWDFAGEDVAETAEATHTFAAPGQFNVALTVTDDKGGVGTVTKPVVVTARTSQDCTTNGTLVDCALTITGTRPVTVKFVMVSEDCDFSGNNLRVTAPVSQSIFLNLCNRLPDEERTLTDPNTQQPVVLQPGNQIVIRFSQGAGDPGDPPTSDPGIKIQGTMASNWTLNIDDGGNAGGQGEPDFNDAVVRVVATPQ
jgi:PKD repeat protein